MNLEEALDKIVELSREELHIVRLRCIGWPTGCRCIDGRGDAAPGKTCPIVDHTVRELLLRYVQRMRCALAAMK